MSRHAIRLRLLTGMDAEWVVEVDEASAGTTAHGFGWDVDKLRASLDEGFWATEERVAWAVELDGAGVGFALATGLDTGTGTIELRILPEERGKGIGRTVLGLLADHHFAEDDRLLRLTGKTHEANVPMQRAFVAAGFRMEARYRDSFEQSDGAHASEWGYALTRTDWESGRLSPATSFDLHSRKFVVANDDATTAPTPGLDQLAVRVLQEGRRVLGRYDGGDIHEGEAAGLLVDDVLTLRLVHGVEIPGRDPIEVTGELRGRLQRLGDGRLELLANCAMDDGTLFDLHLVEDAG